MNRRMRDALIGGALLGIVCVVGAFVRSGFTASPIFRVLTFGTIESLLVLQWELPGMRRREEKPYFVGLFSVS